jgi:hypothetical protein
MSITFDARSHTYWGEDRRRLPGVTEILTTMGVGKIPDHIPEAVLARAAKRGSAVHKAIEERAFQQDDEIQPYVDSWLRFTEESRWVVSQHEQIVFSERHRYAGRLDQVGRYGTPWDSGAFRLLDIKTSSGGRLNDDQKRRAALQLGAYGVAWNECVPDLPVAAGIILTLGPRGYRCDEVNLLIEGAKFIRLVEQFYGRQT